MQIRRPHLNKPLYDMLPWLYGSGGLALLAFSYFRISGWLSVLVALAGLGGITWGLAIGLRRRDFRTMRDEYGGGTLPPDNQD